MGQPIVVAEKPSSNHAVVRFETNRPLSGMGHERYTEPPGDLLRRPVDELARRLFAAGGVGAVHVNGSMITVSLAPGATGAGLADVVRDLFLFYGGPEPTAPAPGADDTASTAAEPALAETTEDVGPAEGRVAEAAARDAAADASAGESPTEA
jgi:hypothetical protein